MISDSKNRKNFTPEIVEYVFERDGWKCRGCGRCDRVFETIPHHIFYKSQLFSDCVSKAENAAVLCKECHRTIHHGSSESDIANGRRVDMKLKSEALGEFIINDSATEEEIEEMHSVLRSIKKPKNQSIIRL